jgi:TolB-like protein
MGADEEGTHERLSAHLRELVDPKIAEHRGRIVKNTGDGLLAEFASVVDAVRCAAEVQRGMIDREPEVLHERQIRFRIGVNLGDVIADADDIFGDGVNVAARLEALAEPGGICVSRVVRDQIRDRLPYQLNDLGEQSVKNIARPVRAYALSPVSVAALPASSVLRPMPRRDRAKLALIAATVSGALVIAGVAWWGWPASRSPTVNAPIAAAPEPVAPRSSIVVLPFANLSNDPDQQYFADGITEDLTTDLSRIGGMFVISRNSAFTYRNKPVNAQQIGRELGVRYLLEGSVQRSGNQLRVTAQLIDAETGGHLWAERFDRDTGDLFALQNEITSRIAIALNLEMIAAEAARPSESPDALDYILRGRAVFPQTRDSYAEAIALFERALALDPHSVVARSLLANTLVARVGDYRPTSSDSDLKRAEELLSHALAASPRNPLAHLVKGQLLRMQGRCAEAIPEYQTFLASSRNAVNALAHIARCKTFIGPIEEAIPLLEQAIRLSPRDPGMWNWYFRIGQAHLLQSRTDEAILWAERARSVNAQQPFVYLLLASAYALKGDTERAGAELAALRRLQGEDFYSSIAHFRRTDGQFGGARPEIRALFEATFFAGLRKAGMPEE